MSDIKVLALDLDGTLTNDQKLVTPRTRAALDAAIKKGVTIVLASGRPTAGIQPLAEELGLDKKGGCILSYNGGKIVDCRTGETLVEKTLDPALVPELCAFAAAQDIAILTYNREGIVCERDKDEWANKECFTTKLPMIHVDDLASCPTTAARSWTAAPARRWWKRHWTLPLCPSCAPLPPRRILPS